MSVQTNIKPGGCSESVRRRQQIDRWRHQLSLGGAAIIVGVVLHRLLHSLRFSILGSRVRTPKLTSKLSKGKIKNVVTTLPAVQAPQLNLQPELWDPNPICPSPRPPERSPCEFAHLLRSSESTAH